MGEAKRKSEFERINEVKSKKLIEIAASYKADTPFGFSIAFGSEDFDIDSFKDEILRNILMYNDYLLKQSSDIAKVCDELKFQLENLLIPQMLDKMMGLTAWPMNDDHTIRVTDDNFNLVIEFMNIIAFLQDAKDIELNDHNGFYFSFKE